jgi:proton glutamate symport protein
MKLHWWILIGVGLGAAVGSALHVTVRGDLAVESVAAEAPPEGLEASTKVDPVRRALAQSTVFRACDGLARVFLKLLKLVVVPLVFFSLISAVSALGDLRSVRRLGRKTIALYFLTSLLALLTGLAIVNLAQPGAGVEWRIPDTAAVPQTPDSVWDVIVALVPDNLVRVASEADLFGVIFFALFFGVVLLTVSEAGRRPTVELVASVSSVLMRMTQLVVATAPLGIAALIARTVAETGPDVFVELLPYVLVVIVGLVTHLVVTLPVLVWFLTGSNPYRFLRAMAPAIVTAFSTASSSGTLGVTIDCARRRAHLPARITNFTLPLGATVNMDGTALYEIVSVIFIAQVHAGLDPEWALDLGMQARIVLIGLVVSVGAAGIPHAGLVMMVIILEAVGLPIAYTGLVWAVDRVLDMSRTAVNVASDACVCKILATSEADYEPAADEGQALG